MLLSVIIPAYNEEKTIAFLIQTIQSQHLPDSITKEIIVVNDGSIDNTSKILAQFSRDPHITVLHQNMNLGKTSAILAGIANSKGDIILIQDADFEYHPKYYPALIEPILKDETLVVYGSRFKGNIKEMTLINKLANIFSNLTFNLCFFAQLTDINTGFKVFKKSVLKNIQITSTHFTFETEITAKLTKQGYRIKEIPIDYIARSNKEGKKINWSKALLMYWGIIKYRFNIT